MASDALSGIDTAVLERTHPHPAAKRLVELLGRRPADVLAARALAAVEPPARDGLEDSLTPATKTFDAHPLWNRLARSVS